MSITSKDPYEALVRRGVELNPCLALLLVFLNRPQIHTRPCRISIINYDKHGSQVAINRPREWRETGNVLPLIKVSENSYGRMLIIEDISTPMISSLGTALDIDPMFFANHVSTEFENLENKPPPPSLALFPSYWSSRPDMFHLQYQRVVDLGEHPIYHQNIAFKTIGNVSRNLRQLPGLGHRHIGIARGCCSVWKKKIGDAWICLILVDNAPCISTSKLGLNDYQAGKLTAASLHGGFEDFRLSGIGNAGGGPSLDKSKRGSLLHELCHYFQEPPPGFSPDDPSILSLCYYPIRIALGEWMTYSHLMSRFVKHYEYSIQDIQSRLHEPELQDLQRWRRRSKQSLHKLDLVRRFVARWMDKEPVGEPWETVLDDVSHIGSQITQCAHSLEQMIPVATSMVQLLDSRRSIEEAVNVRQLTIIALIFVPLSWVASLFSMADDFAPGAAHFWVYFAVALPLTLGVLFGSYILASLGKLNASLSHFWDSLTLQMRYLGSSFGV